MQSHIITCSLDGTIKVWNAIEPASPGAVLDVNTAYTFPPEEPGKPVNTPHLSRAFSQSHKLSCSPSGSSTSLGTDTFTFEVCECPYPLSHKFSQLFDLL